jgi:hypothetical protein
VNSKAGIVEAGPTPGGQKAKQTYKTVSDYLVQAGPALRSLYESLDAFVLGLGDDVSMKTTRYYLAYRRIKNFACVEVHPQTGQLLVFLKGGPGRVAAPWRSARSPRSIVNRAIERENLLAAEATAREMGPHLLSARRWR